MSLVPTVPAFAAYSRVERLVSTVVLGLGLALIASVLFWTLDPRTLDSGESVWLKPIRFCLAFGVHLLTMLWIGRLSTACRRADAAFALGLWLQAVTVIVEMACIVLQAVRGVHSHFNYATPFDRGVFTVMGLGTAVTLLGLALCARGLFHPSEDRLTMRLLVGAMGLAVLGGLIGVLMVMPTPEQRAMLDAGLRPVWIGGVGVGAASGRELPFFAWDLSSGDWRAAHFVGLHALQALPGLAWLAARVTTNLLPSARRWARLGAIAYAALFAAVVMWTAAGRSVVALDRPGGWWVGAPAGVYGLAAVSLCVVVVLSIRRQPPGAGLGVARGANSDQ